MKINYKRKRRENIKQIISTHAVTKTQLNQAALRRNGEKEIRKQVSAFLSGVHKYSYSKRAVLFELNCVSLLPY